MKDNIKVVLKIFKIFFIMFLVMSISIPLLSSFINFDAVVGILSVIPAPVFYIILRKHIEK
jgi:hypothetical protein